MTPPTRRNTTTRSAAPFFRRDSRPATSFEESPPTSHCSSSGSSASKADSDLAIRRRALREYRAIKQSRAGKTKRQLEPSDRSSVEPGYDSDPPAEGGAAPSSRGLYDAYRDESWAKNRREQQMGSGGEDGIFADEDEEGSTGSDYAVTINSQESDVEPIQISAWMQGIRDWWAGLDLSGVAWGVLLFAGKGLAFLLNLLALALTYFVVISAAWWGWGKMAVFYEVVWSGEWQLREIMV